MTSGTTQDLIRYDVLVQEALRGVVKKVLQEIVKTGLPGQHHFYVSFDTRHPGVRLSTRMRQRYPEEMTIVLQHQFWDLVVTDYALEVGLSFGGIPERLLVPFTAIKGFFDPSVQFGLQFEVGGEAANDETDEAAAPAAPKPAAALVRPDQSEPAPPKPAPAALRPAAVETTKDKPAREPAAKDKSAKDKAPAEPAAKGKAPAEPAADAAAPAKVISMDSFRKKT
jgi:hypothetical protein